ncbi:MAG: hypothetical protein J3K34DRAFT_294179 [Monoraphidium minutum]|nr:MAG: hypothetical protein J3K34DRAFT_294179 [Monoraphidium minutum]
MDGLGLGGDLGDLLAQLAATQEKKATVKLSDRNVVELVTKLKSLGLVGDDLLHTINGKEYITAARLRRDVEGALAAGGGRLELAELPALVGVDLSHCEKQAALIVAESGGAVVEAAGELMTTQYFDALAAEVDDLLQESGVLGIADLAVSYGLGSELLLSALRPRAGAAGPLRGRLEGQLLYTPAYVRNLKAQLRGALRGAGAPAPLAGVVKELGIDALGGGGGGVVSGLVDELVAAGDVQGALKGGVQGGVWTPAVYSGAQAAAVRGFYEQNGWVAYDTARRMGVANDRAYLQATFPEGLALETAFVSPSLLVQLEAGIDEVALAGGWLDASALLPPALAPGDVSLLLQRCHAAQQKPGGASEKERRGGKGGGSGDGEPPRFRRVEVLAGSCVVAGQLLEEAREKLQAAAKAAAEQAILERRAGGGAKSGGGGGGGDASGGGAAGGGGKKAVAAGSDDDDDWGRGGKKGGKKGGKGGGKAKGGGGGGKPAGGGGGGKGAKGGGGGGAADDAGGGALALETLAAAVLETHPDMEGAGIEEEDLPAAIAALLRPAAVAAYQSALAAAFTAGAEARRRGRDAAGRALEEAFARLQLYSHGCDALQDDEALQTLLSRHAARTTGAEGADALLRWCQLEFGDDDAALAGGGEGGGGGGGGGGAAGYTAAERAKLVKGLSPDVAAPVAKAVEALAAGGAQEVADALEAAAAECGLRLRRLDKKAEKAALAAAKGRLVALLADEPDPAAALALALPLLHLKATGRLLSVPGRAMGPVLQRLKGQLPDEGFAAAQAFLEDVVESLKQQGGGGGGEAAGARLAEALPRLKALAGSGGGEAE